MNSRPFYSEAVSGWPLVVRRMVGLADASPQQLVMILGDTARLANLGAPEANPTAEALQQYTRITPPLWLAKTALFLMLQMPQKPQPESPEEHAAWAYLWLRIKTFDSEAAAVMALPLHLKKALAPWVSLAWEDVKQQRLL